MIPFIKMHGAGNDFVVIDNRKGGLPALNWRKLADRHFGIGCDQVIVLEPSQKANLFMRIYNADGGEVESCGNASRCVGWLVAKETGKPATIETLAGVIEAQMADDGAVTINMGAPKFEWQDIPLSEAKDTVHLGIALHELSDPVAVSMGNPHMVFFVPDLEAVAMERVGPALEVHPLFPKRANVGVAQIVSPGSPLPSGERIKVRGGDMEELPLMHLRVWERGAGLTLACGTGACAALVAAVRRGLMDRKAKVKLPGGTLLIEWRESDNCVYMTGPAVISFGGGFETEEYRV